MNEQSTEAFDLNAGATMSLAELVECCGLTAAEIDELVDYCALAPLDQAAPEWVFSARWVVPLRKVAKLRVDFDLDMFSLAIVLGHLDRIAQLEQQVQSLQAQMSVHGHVLHHE